MRGSDKDEPNIISIIFNYERDCWALAHRCRPQYSYFNTAIRAGTRFYRHIRTK